MTNDLPSIDTSKDSDVKGRHLGRDKAGVHRLNLGLPTLYDLDKAAFMRERTASACLLFHPALCILSPYEAPPIEQRRPPAWQVP